MGCPAAGSETTFLEFSGGRSSLCWHIAGTSVASSPESLLRYLPMRESEVSAHMRESEVSAQRGLRYPLMREHEVSAHDGDGTDEQNESFSAVM